MTSQSGSFTTPFCRLRLSHLLRLQVSHRQAEEEEEDTRRPHSWLLCPPPRDLDALATPPVGEAARLASLPPSKPPNRNTRLAKLRNLSDSYVHQATRKQWRGAGAAPQRTEAAQSLGELSGLFRLSAPACRDGEEVGTVVVLGVAK